MQKHCIKSSSNICFGRLLESPQRGDSNRYRKHMFYEEIRIKQGFFHILFCPLRILYNSKFIIMATFLGTNAVVVTRVHCTYQTTSQENIVRQNDMIRDTAFPTRLNEYPSKTQISLRIRALYR